jgi:hypothetical protein
VIRKGIEVWQRRQIILDGCADSNTLDSTRRIIDNCILTWCCSFPSTETSGNDTTPMYTPTRPINAAETPKAIKARNCRNPGEDGAERERREAGAGHDGDCTWLAFVLRIA